MTYLALARKWRPKTFTEVMGQTHVVKALSNALNSGRVHHAFLFTGTRGVGKTTLARIFAKSLNCEQGMTATPCGECSICVNVDQGNFIDLIEVDAASRTGIDDMRELLDNIQYAPTQGRFKVYLIDEIHMLSKSSFNALLKTLEEPPEHIKFLFATTDPQKLPVTVLSRCLQFNLKALQPDEIVRQLSHILSAEDIQFDNSGLELISRAADGSLRDALSLLEQAIAQGAGSVDAESVRAMLGTVKASHMDELVDSIIHNDAVQALSTIHNMATYSADFNAAINELLIEMHTIALAHIAADTLNYKVTDVEKYLNYAKQISAEDVQLCYQIALIAKRDIALAPDYRSGFEMAVMRIIAFKPVDEARSQNSISNETSAIETSAIETSAIETTAIETTAIETTEINSPTYSKENNVELHKDSESFAEQSVNVVPNIKQTEVMREHAQTVESNIPEIHSDKNTEELQERASADDSLLENQASHTNIAPSIADAKDLIESQSIDPPIHHFADQNAVDSNNNSNIDLEGSHRRAPSKPQVSSLNTTTDKLDTDSNRAPLLPTEGFNATITARPAPTVNKTDIPVMNKGRAVPELNQQPSETTQSSIETVIPQAAITTPTPEQTTPNVVENRIVENNVVDDDDPSTGLPQAPHNEWAGFVEQLQLNGLVRELAMNMACADIQIEPMHLSLDPNFQYMKNASREEAIIDEVRKLRGANYQVTIAVESTVHETPAERIKRLSSERDKNTLQELKDDPKVQSVMNAFDMTIDESSVKPK